LSFFDEGDEPRTATRTTRPAARRPDSRRRGADDRTLLLRRAGAALVVVLVVVLIVLGIKTLVDRQATNGLKTYAQNVNSLVASEEANVRLPFFNQLDLAYNSANQSAVANDIQQEVLAAEDNYRTAQSWSVPSQMVAAQRDFVSALGLRHQALATIEAAIPSALGAGDQGSAIKQIAGAMQLFLASDVLYSERVKPLIQQSLANAGVTGQTVSDSTFLPDVAWLVPQTTANRILGYVPVSLGGAPPTGSNGHELVGVTYTAGGKQITLATSGLNTITLGSAGVTFDLSVLNSGTGIVHDVITKVSFNARSVDATCLDQESSIPETKPTLFYASPIVVVPKATCPGVYGVPLKMTAEVKPVPGENDTHNNYIHALVEFTQ
jgi:hypothetical protein